MTTQELSGTTHPTAIGPSHGARAETAVYVFAVCRRIDPADLTGLPGLADGSPVRALPFGALTAVVQDVPAAEFTEEAWHRRLGDRLELERCARAHHEVVTAAAACGPTVPLALATLYHGEARAKEILGRDADRFGAALDRIDGRAEWGVKVYVSATPAASRGGEPASARTDSPAGTGAGRAYLQRKRGQHRAREQHHDRTLRLAEDIDTELSRLAAAARRLRLHGQEATGEEHRVQILNATYLVAASAAEELRAAVAGLRRRTGAHIEMSGPWVPYSFVGEV
ncbi:GvpL/GvpF family gas vesicle protein [Streptomyces tubercidicus]|uniref:Gas vesicle protein n=1 Tax=Streptomyces tubercidicus TaxID=47759 RepID=A0A640V181_9ACTN|nr:GvpL/GvpF family gas vesicle protein [Streptomyces tubercidicus]WAU16299.1 GvpL/GvpF family gas vesicle protein [Streptomyces tubercidicus]GFE42258.1 gas vesicle protein [Streptomyces tubercidicus]